MSAAGEDSSHTGGTDDANAPQTTAGRTNGASGMSGGSKPIRAGSAGQSTASAGVGASGQPSTPQAGGNPAPVSGIAGTGSAGSNAPPMYPERSREPIPLRQTEVAPETADADALLKLASWGALPVFATDNSRQSSSQDRGRGAESESVLFRPVLADGERDLNNFVCASSDADLGPVGVPYRYDQETCPETYVHGVELARFEGSGRMLRFNMAVGGLATRGITLMDEMLRIYVDDNPRAIVQVPLAQMLTGAAGEIFATPFGSIANNSITWYYPVVFASKLVVALDVLRSDYYYEIDAALDAAPQPRSAPPFRLSERDAAHSRLVNASPLSAAATSLRTENVVATPNGSSEVELAGPATIQELRLRIPQDKLASLSSVRIVARWDGADQAAIDLPILQLFAAARSPVAGSNLALASNVEGADRVLSLRLPMPFETKARWTIANTGIDTIGFTLEWLGEAQVPAEEFGHLYAQLNEPQQPLTTIEQPVAQASTRGRLVGVCADLTGRAETSTVTDAYADPLNLVTNDVRATSDGQVVLDSLSTDSYADNGFLFLDSPKTTPFAQNWSRVQDNAVMPPGQISLCRWHVLGNEIDFQRDLTVVRKAARRDAATASLHRTLAFLYLR